MSGFTRPKQRFFRHLKKYKIKLELGIGCQYKTTMIETSLGLPWNFICEYELLNDVTVVASTATNARRRKERPVRLNHFF